MMNDGDDKQQCNYTNNNDESGEDIDDAFCASSAFAHTVKMLGGGEDKDEYVLAPSSKKYPTSGGDSQEDASGTQHRWND